MAWAVFLNNDLTEGRGPMVLKKLFVHKQDADAYAFRLEPYGYFGQFTSVKPYDILDNQKAEDLLDKMDEKELLIEKKKALQDEIATIEQKIRNL